MQNEQLHNLFFYRNTIRVIETEDDDMAERVTHVSGMTSTHTILVGKANGKT
jgi:hypothetical protein